MGTERNIQLSNRNRLRSYIKHENVFVDSVGNKESSGCCVTESDIVGLRPLEKLRLEFEWEFESCIVGIERQTVGKRFNDAYTHAMSSIFSFI